MINGAHAIIYSKDPEADRVFLRDALQLPDVDVGEGWLIFALPPAEVAVHPGDKNDVHELYLMVADLARLVAVMEKRGVSCAPPRDRGWGILTHVSLPGGGKLGIYEPRHARPRWSKPARARAGRARTGRRTPSRSRTGARRPRRG